MPAIKYKECNESMLAVNINMQWKHISSKQRMQWKHNCCKYKECDESKAAVNKGVTINAQQT